MQPQTARAGRSVAHAPDCPAFRQASCTLSVGASEPVCSGAACTSAGGESSPGCRKRRYPAHHQRNPSRTERSPGGAGSHPANRNGCWRDPRLRENVATNWTSVFPSPGPSAIRSSPACPTTSWRQASRRVLVRKGITPRLILGGVAELNPVERALGDRDRHVSVRLHRRPH